MLMESKHRDQVRLILLDENMLPTLVDPVTIWERTCKPVLVISGETQMNSRCMFHYQDKVILAAGIEEESAKRVLKKVYPNSQSKALRIAGIILESILGLHNV